MTVTFIMLDGVRPDALMQVDAPNIHKLRCNGSYTMQARSLMPTMTLPCHTSIFHSVPPERHGIRQNVFMPFARPLPGLIEQAHKYDKTCAFFFNWEPLRDMARPGSLHHSFFARNNKDFVRGDHIVADAAATHIAAEHPDFAFVYLGTPDEVGHQSGWMSEPYLKQIEHIDSAVGQVIESLPEGSTVLIQADHGGHERTHGTNQPADILIPWMIAGPNIKRNYQIDQTVTLLETAPTLAYAMGIPVAQEWEGEVVREIFVDDDTLR